MSEDRMTILDRLRNPAWVYGHGLNRTLETEPTLKVMSEAAEIIAGLGHKLDDRAKLAYDTFRGGFGDQPCPAPPWDEAPAWIRDIVRVAYFQGTLDRKRTADM